MARTTDTQRLSSLRRLTTELLALRERMNDTVDQMVSLMQGSDALDLALPGQLADAADGAIESHWTPAALSGPLETVFLNDPAQGGAFGADCHVYSDNKSGHVQLVQVPAMRGADARFAVHANYASFDGTWMSLVFDARRVLEGLPAGKLRLTIAVELGMEPVVKLAVKCGFKVAGQAGEHTLQPRGGRILVDTFEVPQIDPATVDQLDFHVILSPAARGFIELRRLSVTASVMPATAGVATHVFEGAA